VTAADGPGAVEDPVEVLQRWESAGAVWRVVGRSGGTVRIALLTCDGGEQVGEVRCPEEAVCDHLAGRDSNEPD